MMNITTQKEEEYKHIANAIIESDKRIIQILTATSAVVVTLLSAITALIFGKEGTNITISLAYIALTPNLLLIPSFSIMLATRIDIIRLGSYRRVFFEELSGIEGWEIRLEKFRKLDKMESNDPVPLTIWLMAFVSMALFSFMISKGGGLLYCHLLIPIILIVWIGWIHYKWQQVITIELPRYVELWSKIASLKK